MKKLNARWMQGFKRDSQDYKDFESLVRNSTQLLDKLHRIIESYEIEIWEAEGSKPDYSKDWSHLQAHRNGEKEVLRQLKKLTEHLD